jgi:P-type E1-E2 ATPase
MPWRGWDKLDAVLPIVITVDPVKATTPEAPATLKSAGIAVVIVTGDRVPTAKFVAAKLGIAEVYGEVKPHDKPAVRNSTAGKNKRPHRRSGKIPRHCVDVL